MTSPDYLSACPSLLDILALVKAHIPNCKLVSRILRDKSYWKTHHLYEYLCNTFRGFGHSSGAELLSWSGPAQTPSVNLFSIDICKRPKLELAVSPEAIPSLTHITDNWEQADCRDSFSFLLTTFATDFFPNNFWTWSRRELAAALTNDLQSSTVEFDSRHLDDDKDFCVRITRNSDGLVLELYFKRDNRILTMVVGTPAPFRYR